MLVSPFVLETVQGCTLYLQISQEKRQHFKVESMFKNQA